MGVLTKDDLKEIEGLFWKNLMMFNNKVLTPQFGEIREDISEIREDMCRMDRKLALG